MGTDTCQSNRRARDSLRVRYVDRASDSRRLIRPSTPPRTILSIWGYPAGRGSSSSQTSQVPIPARVRCSSGSPKHEIRAPDFGQVCVKTAKGQGRGEETQQVAVRGASDHDILWCGWRGRIRTFDLLIQSQIPESGLAGAVLNVIRRSTALGFRVSQVPIRKRIRCPSAKRDESGAHVAPP